MTGWTTGALIKRQLSLSATSNYHKLAGQGLERCRLSLAEKNPQAAIHAGQTIKHQFALLETESEIGRPFDDLPELRELIIPFGDSGYVALYHHEIKTNSVYVFAFRYQKEAGYY